jgi:hypothetical protein
MPLPPLELEAAVKAGVHTVCGGDRVIAVASDWTAAWALGVKSGAWLPTATPDVEVRGRLEAPVPTVTSVPTLPDAMVSHWSGSQYVWWSETNEFQVTSPGSGEAVDVTMRGVGITYDPVADRWMNVLGGPSLLANTKSLAWKDGAAAAVAPDTEGLPTLYAYRPTKG